MKTPQVASAAAVREALAPLTIRQIDALAQLSGVPSPTLYKIKRGITPNPGIETVRKFIDYVRQAARTAP